MDESDSLAVITTKPPAFSEAEAVEIAARHYGMDVRVRPLISERDQNFRMIAADGGEYVLKIANVAEERVVTDFQVQALLYIERSIRERQLPVTVPRIQPTLSGVPLTLEQYTEIGKRFGMVPGAVKVAALRLRRKYRDTIREIIAQTVIQSDDVADELEELLSALRG